MAASSACLVGYGPSTSGTKTVLKDKLFHGHAFATRDRSMLLKFPKAYIVKASLDQGKNQGRRDFFKLLLGNVGLASTLTGGKNAYADEQEVSSSRMSYSRFLEYLDKDRVQRVDLYQNGTISIVEAISPELGNRVQRVWVQLPGHSQELLQKLREKNIDFAAHNAQEDSGSVLLNLIGNLAFPLLLIGGLFLLSRRSSGAMCNIVHRCRFKYYIA